MKSKKIKRMLAIILSMILIFSLLIGCSKKVEPDNIADLEDGETNNENKDDKKTDEEDKSEDEDEEKGEEEDNNSYVKFEVTNVDIPFEKTEVVPEVEPYKTESDFSNIVNAEQFGDFSSQQMELLVANNFVVNPTKEEQLFYIYEENQYNDLPSFITTDSVLQVYHIFYDYYLRTLESEKLLPLAEELNDHMLASSVDLYNSIDNEEIKAIQLKNIAFLAVAQLALEREIPGDLPQEAKELARQEFKLIEEAEGFSKSPLLGFDLDYSQYLPRGHYTRSEDFERYFKALMWYGQVPFPLYNKNGDRNIEQTSQALLLSYSVYKDKVIYDNWENIYEPTNFFVGSSDDLGIYEYGKLLFKVYGENPDLNTLNDSEKLDELYKEVEKLPEPRIQAKLESGTTPVGKQFRFMGQRYVLDADIIQQLVESNTRPLPSGLDVMGVLGSERAEEIQMEKEKAQKESGFEIWDKYPEKFAEKKEEFSKLSQEEWKSNMYQGWIWTLHGFLKPFEDGYPSFMTNNAWIDKDLNTALASWSELKHDTILYGKQSSVEMGAGEEVIVKGYVEPNIEVYEKLMWLTKFSRENMKVRDLSVESIDEKMEKFEDLLEFLINCSVKQLNNEELTEDEYYRLSYYGGTLEDLTSSFAGDGVDWYSITSDTDKNMAVIADFHNIGPNAISPPGYLEAGVGNAYEIYVVVPIGDELYLTRGSVFSYHEFVSDERLTDEKWQQMLKEDSNPPMPEWTHSFIRDGKGEIPKPYDQYNE